MKSFFRRPLFPFHDPFFFPMPRPYRLRVRVPIENRVSINSNDPHHTFQRFFDEHGVKENERDFFEKHYPEKYEKKFNPYEVLGIEKDASLDQIKQAYRTQALKFHPKNSSTPESVKKFQELGRAYNELTSQISSREQQNVFSSFFNDFDRQIESFFRPLENNVKKNMKQIGKQAKNSEPQISEEQAKFIENADLYSESTFVETKNGKNQKVVIEKEYKKDNNILKVRREEQYKDDGSKQVTETLDDGKEVKKKVFTENKQQKKLTS